MQPMTKSIPIAILCLAICGQCWAQAASDAQPAPTNILGAQYPRVLPDNRVTFELRAPNAQQVRVQIPGGPFEMAKGADGVWSVTTTPLVPGFHYYTFIVDGVAMNDYGSHAFYGTSKDSSGVEVPEKGVDYYSQKDVPHGDVRIHSYFSRITGRLRRCFVYTPPDYDTNIRARYPVLYLQHGSGEDETGWTFQGHANLILDNLIAAKKAVPMIIVMDNGYATPAGQPLPQAPPTAPPIGAAGRGAAGGRGAGGSSAFEDVVIKEIIPMVDATYRTIADREHRAIAGLSMGANQAASIGTHNLDKFAFIGGFSGTMNA